MRSGPVTWHDVECASYAADLPLWHELATAARGPVLELGAGTGRVALELARAGHDVTALDSEAALAAELARRARAEGLTVDTVTADARSFALSREFALITAPMQVVQLLGGAEGRRAALERCQAHLLPGGLLALALADPFEGLEVDDALPPLPDVREEEGWVLSSLPVAVRFLPGAVAIDRLRQAVSPAGEFAEELNTVSLDDLTPEELEQEAVATGLRAAGRRQVPATHDHIGSAVVLLEAVR